MKRKKAIGRKRKINVVTLKDVMNRAEDRLLKKDSTEDKPYIDELGNEIKTMHQARMDRLKSPLLNREIKINLKDGLKNKADLIDAEVLKNAYKGLYLDFTKFFFSVTELMGRGKVIFVELDIFEDLMEVFMFDYYRKRYSGEELKEKLDSMTAVMADYLDTELVSILSSDNKETLVRPNTILKRKNIFSILEVYNVFKRKVYEYEDFEFEFKKLENVLYSDNDSSKYLLYVDLMIKEGNKKKLIGSMKVDIDIVTLLKLYYSMESKHNSKDSESEKELEIFLNRILLSYILNLNKDLNTTRKDN